MRRDIPSTNPSRLAVAIATLANRKLVRTVLGRALSRQAQDLLL